MRINKPVYMFFFAICFVLIVFSCFLSDKLEDVNSEPNEAVLTETKNVLYISSYSPSLFTFDEQKEGIRKRFANQPVNLDIEYMDTKNFPTPENLANFKKSLKYKLEHGKKYDAVIVGDDNGLLFLMENKPALFPDTPIFFLGINSIETAIRSSEDPLVTGVVEAKSMKKTLDLALMINPQAERVVSLKDNTVSSQAAFADLFLIAEDYPQLEFISINVSDGTYENFFSKVEALDKNDILFWNAAVSDIDGRAMNYDEMLDILDSIVSTPIFGTTTYGLGDGIIGGCLISHVDQGYAAADMVFTYFRGTPVDKIPFSTESPNVNMIDYSQLKKYGFSGENLPKDTVLINREYTFWEQYGKIFILIIIIIIIELIIIFLLVTNILIRRRTEVALRKNEEKFRSYIESAPDGIFIVNREGELLDVNESACRITGYTRNELLGISVGIIISEEIIHKMTKTGHLRDETRIISKSGECRFCNIEVVKLSETRYLGFAKDITERKETQEKKEKLESQLQQSRKMDAVGQLAGGIAHDFNNILGAIMGAAQLLQSPDRDPDDETLHLLEMIMTSSQRAADLNAKLLAFGRKGKVSSSTVEMCDVVDDTLAILEQTIDRRIEISIVKDAENSKVIGDGSALQNSLLNICINSTHAMPDGGELGLTMKNISLNHNYCINSPFDIEPGQFIDIEIRDTGTGIAPEFMDKIFEPFFTTKAEGKGTGLGLAAVYGTVQDHKGALTVFSKPDKGTVFHIIIPCSESEPQVSTSVEPEVRGTGVILLVDDEEYIRETGKYTLEEMGFNVILAGNGVEAVNLFREKHKEIDLVIMDMIMPRMYGSDAFLLMKEIDNHCKVVISSGFTGYENLEKLKENGLLGFIQKPYTKIELFRQVSKFLV